MASLHKIFKVA